MSPQHMEVLVKRVYPKLHITKVFHPRVKDRLIEMKNGVNVQFERGPFGYQLSNGEFYPPRTNLA